jgi:hypothetical protein
MKGSTLKTTDRAQESSLGPMVANIPAHGRRAKCMAKELIGTRMASKQRECGLRDNALLF